jgi:tRNA pseudouridine55 synthase
MAVIARGRCGGYQSRPELNGLLNIDKPLKWTSHDVVAKMRGVLGVRRIGHTGTLDPMATGVLLLCVGKATRMARFLMGLDKEYLATMRLGGVSDTLDAQGQISISEESPKVSLKDLHEIFRRFTGQLEQIPPMFSAVKHKGQPLYRLARQGKTVERRPKTVVIRSLEIYRFEPPHVTFQVACSSGTYIRVLAADVGGELGCGAYLTSLSRTKVGPFQLQDALPVSRAMELAFNEQLEACLLPVSQGLEAYPRLVVHPWAVTRILNGQSMTREIFQEVDPGAQRGDELRIEDPEGKLLAMAQLLIAADDFSKIAPADRVCKALRIMS